MQYLKNVTLSFFILDELIVFATRLLEAIKNNGVESEMNQRRMRKLRQIIDVLVDARKPRKSKYTPILKQKDGMRDDALQGLCDIIRIYMNYKDPAIAAAATELYELIPQTPSEITSSGYMKQTAKENKFLNTLGEHKDLLKLFPAMDWFDFALETNDDLEDTYNEKIKVEDQTPEVSSQEMKKTISRCIDNTLEDIDLLIDDDTNEFAKLMENVNALISDVMQQVRSRRTRNDNDDDDKAEPQA